MIDSENIVYNFLFKANDTDFRLSMMGESRADALKKIRAALAVVINDINQELPKEK
jgi:hypothetical protein